MSAETPRMTLPNIMTLARLGAIPLFLVVFYLPFTWSDLCAAAIFLAAGITDMLDGYLARRMGQTSRFGAFLDPVADKLVVAAALIMLVQVHDTVWLVVPAIVIVSREIAVSALREWMAEIGQRARVAVGGIGKIKTVAQIAAITGLLAHKPALTKAGELVMSPLAWLSYGLLYLAMALTLWSMVAYLKAAWPELWPRGEEE